MLAELNQREKNPYRVVIEYLKDASIDRHSVEDVEPESVRRTSQYFCQRCFDQKVLRVCVDVTRDHSYVPMLLAQRLTTESTGRR